MLPPPTLPAALAITRSAAAGRLARPSDPPPAPRARPLRGRRWAASWLCGALLAVLCASASAAAAPCHTSLRALYERARDRSRAQAARSRPVIESSELRARPPAALPGEHLRMYRASREAARAAGPAALARHDLAYARALLGAREYFELRRGGLYESIYYALERGERARADALRAWQAGFERAAKAADEELVVILGGVSSAPGIPAELAGGSLLERGLALARLGRDDEAQAALEELVREHPGRPEWPLALLLRADDDLKEGRVGEARRGFQRLTRGQPGLLRALAYYRLAGALLAGDERVQPDPEASLRAFVVALAEARTYDADTYLARQLRRDARRDLPRAYAAARGPDDALATIRLWGADAVRGEDMTGPMGHLLAEQFLALDRPDAAASIYRQLLAASPGDPQVCRWRARIVLSTLARDDPAGQWAALLDLLAATRADAPAPRREACRYEAADYLVAMAGEWHLRGVTEGDRALRRRADQAYRAFAQALPEHPRRAAMARDQAALERGDPPAEPTLCAVASPRPGESG